MKKISIIMSLASIPGMLIAQQAKPKYKKTETVKKENAFTSQAVLTPILQMDQRKIYHWDIGQRSTPTGRLATEPFARYALVLGDSAVVVNDPYNF